ncbi:MAG: hypothetical protein ABEK59_02095 [Halobacteria archaeon]
MFSYRDGLQLEKAFKIQDPKRAAYIGDTLYILSDSEMVAVNKKNWQRMKTLDLGDS